MGFETETLMLLLIVQGDSLIGVSMDSCEKEGCLPLCCRLPNVL